MKTFRPNGGWRVRRGPTLFARAVDNARQHVWACQRHLKMFQLIVVAIQLTSCIQIFKSMCLRLIAHVSLLQQKQSKYQSKSNSLHSNITYLMRVCQAPIFAKVHIISKEIPSPPSLFLSLRFDLLHRGQQQQDWSEVLC